MRPSVRASVMQAMHCLTQLLTARLVIALAMAPTVPSFNDGYLAVKMPSYEVKIMFI